MKKTLTGILALLMAVTLIACSTPADTPSGDNDTTDAPSENETVAGDDQGGGDETQKGTTEKCMFCVDVEGNDRKCDTCGYWIHEKGEAWTKEVPANVKITVVDYHDFYYQIEKIGDGYYIKSWLNKADYESGIDYTEEYITMTKRYNRRDGQWEESSFTVKYGDAYEMFALHALLYLSGNSLSDQVERALEATTVGNETVIGKDCVIKEYDGYFGIKYKIWLNGNMPLKTAQMDTNSETEYKTMFEVLGWDESITAFSTDVPG